MYYPPSLEINSRLFLQTEEKNKQTSLYYKFDTAHKKLLEQKLLLKTRLIELQSKKSFQLFSKNSIWDAVKLIDRFKKAEYHSLESKVELLRADAIHHAKEMALVEPVTRFSYWHTINKNQTKGDGYYEDLGLMLNTFCQDLVRKGFNASRASIETLTFERAKQALTQIAMNGTNNAVLITSFPDVKDVGYHGVDSKFDWDKPETHHSFFYLLRVGEIIRDNSNTVTSFEIKTTQYRAWPNARQAIQIHEQLGQSIIDFDAPIPNLLFANVIQLNPELLKNVLSNTNRTIDNTTDITTDSIDESEDSFEELFREFLYLNSEEHLINYTQLPKVDKNEFWQIQEEYFTHFYLAVALPVFEEISELLSTTQKLDKKTQKILQIKVDYLDKAFFYYSKILLGWIKVHNSNPNYATAFRERRKFRKIIDFQQKILLRILGQKQNNKIPSVEKLKEVLDIDHRLSTRQPVSSTEKKKLLSVWGFFSFVGNLSSLLQCGVMTPFSLKLSILNNSNNLGNTFIEFSSSLSHISIPDKQKFLATLQNEEYVELDLTHQNPPAKKIFTVPKSYLEGKGCIVDSSGTVLGPCIDPLTNERIPLDDPRDSLAFPMTLIEFNQFMRTLQKSIENSTLTEIDQIFQSENFTQKEKRQTQLAIKKLRQKLIKQSLGLQEFITGNITKHQYDSNNKLLKELVLKLSFSLNPVETLTLEVEKMLQEKQASLTEVLEQTNYLEINP